MSEGSFEAKVSAKRETSGGIFLTLQVQPDDYTADLATLRVGAALQIGWAEIIDTSVHRIELESPQARGAIGGHARAEALSPERRSEIASQAAETRWSKPKRKFSELSLPEQAGIRSCDAQFNVWLRRNTPAEWWDISNSDPASVLRAELGVQSRSELSTNHEAANKWRALESSYQRYLVTQQYAESIRR